MTKAIACAAALCPPALSQSNVVPGLDARLTHLEDPSMFGRRGPAFPDGEVGMTYSYYMCNSGSVVIPWLAPSGGTQPMATQHPMTAFLVAREDGDRIVQITDLRTFVKHAHGAANTSGACGTCQHPGTNAAIGVDCTDAYSAATNANRYYLGPQEEVDPWLGTWEPIHSYFDRGDPDVGFPQNQDGVRSLTSGAFADPVQHLVTLRERDLVEPGRFLYAMHLVVAGEAGAAHLDNMGYREMVPTFDGAVWTFGDGPLAYTTGSVLDAWTGASVQSAGNGADDGAFFVAVKVTEPTPGTFHYEYAVHDFDNARGAATLRIPLCASATLSGPGFRDVDDDPLNDWTAQRIGDELVFQAPAGNALQWNQLFNFWFDCDMPPVAGAVELDQALPGPGALSVAVGAEVPAGPAALADLGPGCGAPPPALTGNGLPTLGNAAFALDVAAAPGAAVLLFYSVLSTAQQLAPGCTQYLDAAGLVTHEFLLLDGAGAGSFAVPVPNDPLLDGVDVYWQAAELAAGGPVFSAFAVSNGVGTRLGCR
ncbi:MAG: hypothetical protein AB7O97_02915 [Planctomycetota bacterium]